MAFLYIHNVLYHHLYVNSKNSHLPNKLYSLSTHLISPSPQLLVTAFIFYMGYKKAASVEGKSHMLLSERKSGFRVTT